jgi:hypothetical protein
MRPKERPRLFAEAEDGSCGVGSADFGGISAQSAIAWQKKGFTVGRIEQRVKEMVSVRVLAFVAG